MLSLNAYQNLPRWVIIQENLKEKIATLFSKKHCLYVNSGSSALFIGVELLISQRVGEVITPALTFSTSIGCLIKNNLVPVFVDVEELTYNIDCSQIEEMITEKTVAILHQI